MGSSRSNPETLNHHNLLPETPQQKEKTNPIHTEAYNPKPRAPNREVLKRAPEPSSPPPAQGGSFLTRFMTSVWGIGKFRVEVVSELSSGV